MDVSRVSFGEMVAAISGVALFLFMFVDWFGYRLGVGLFDAESAGLNAWEWLSFLDILLFLAVAIAVGVAVSRAAGSMPTNPPFPPGQLLAFAGALALVIVVFRLLVPGDGPDPGGELGDVTRKVGLFLGLIAAGGMAYGGYTALNERPAGAGPGPGRAPRPRPTPPRSEAPRSEPPRSEAPRSEPPRSEPPRSEASRSESPRSEPPP